MGERTQLLINIVNEKDEQICGTIIHYQWGYGRVMLMDALNIAINLPWSYKLHDEFRYTNTFSKLDDTLKKEIKLRDPVFARNFRKYIANITNGSLYLYEFEDDLTLLREYNSIENANQLEMYLEKLDLIYNLTIDDFQSLSLDNNCGYMVMKVLYKDGCPEKINFYFMGNYGLGYDNRENLTFEQYCNAQDVYTHNQMSKYNFAQSYKSICEGYGITLH